MVGGNPGPSDHVLVLLLPLKGDTPLPACLRSHVSGGRRLRSLELARMGTARLGKGLGYR